MKRVLSIAGSLRRGSCNRLLLAAAAECAPPGMVVSTCEALAAVPLFDEDLEAATSGGPAAVRRVRDEVARADGLLIATPEYNHSIPGVLKNAIDWLSRPGPEEVLVGKPVAIVGATRGRWGTRLAQAALRQVLYATESLVLPKVGLFVREAESAFDESGRLVDPSTRTQLTALMAAFSDWIELTASGGRG